MTLSAGPLRTAFLAVLAVTLNGAPIPGVVSTGIVLFTDVTGTYDANWKIGADPFIATPAKATLGLAPGWAANNSASAWISPLAYYDGGAASPPGVSLYRLAFSLAGLDASTALISYSVSADNAVVDVRLNGTVVQGPIATDPSQLPLGGFLITSAFLPGANELVVAVNNSGSSPSPTGLRLEVLSATADPGVTAPEPSTFVLALAGLAAVLIRRRDSHTSA